MTRRTLICCSFENLRSQGSPHKCHDCVGLASCTLLSYMNNLHFALKKNPSTSWLVKKQTMPTYLDACFRTVLREQVVLPGAVTKSLFKRLLPFPPIPQFTEYLKFITIESRAAQFMALLYMKKTRHKSKKTVI